MGTLAQSIPDFCRDHGFSRATYYNLPTAQRPAEMRVGGRVLKDAERLNIDSLDRHRYVRLDGAKANMSLATNQATWFRRETVVLPNGPKFTEGDHVGVLEPVDMREDEARARAKQEEYRADLAAEIAPMLDAGERSVNSIAEALAPQKGKSQSTLRNHIEDAFRDGRRVDDQVIWVGDAAGKRRTRVLRTRQVDE